MTIVIRTNLKCGNCLAKLQPKLDTFDGVDSWHADLSDPRKLLYVDLAANTDLVQVLELIRKQGFEAEIINRDSNLSTENVSDSNHLSSWLVTYKPLVLVVAYVLGATLLMLQAAETSELSLGMTYFMGIFFLGFAFFKLLDVPKFADAFATYDIVAKRSRTYALAYPWIEVTLGFMFVTRIAVLAANIATACIMSVGLIGVIAAVRRKQTIQCACLGTVFKLPMSAVTIIENSVMIVMSGIMIVARLLG